MPEAWLHAACRARCWGSPERACPTGAVQVGVLRTRCREHRGTKRRLRKAPGEDGSRAECVRRWKDTSRRWRRPRGAMAAPGRQAGGTRGDWAAGPRPDTCLPVTTSRGETDKTTSICGPPRPLRSIANRRLRKPRKPAPAEDAYPTTKHHSTGKMEMIKPKVRSALRELMNPRLLKRTEAGRPGWGPS